VTRLRTTQLVRIGSAAVAVGKSMVEGVLRG